jgi:hypothetical protein
MKIRTVKTKEEINLCRKDEEMVHFTFRPSNTDILSLVKLCPTIKAIHIPYCHMKTISDSTRMFLEMQGITLLEGDIWDGQKKDIIEYSIVKPKIFDRMIELKKKGLSESEIVGTLGKETQLSKNFLTFLLDEKMGKVPGTFIE